MLAEDRDEDTKVSQIQFPPWEPVDDEAPTRLQSRPAEAELRASGICPAMHAEEFYEVTLDGSSEWMLSESDIITQEAPLPPPRWSDIQDLEELIEQMF